MRTFRSLLRDFFWPNPPEEFSGPSLADLESRGFRLATSRKNRRAVDAWLRERHEAAAADRRDWIRRHAIKFARRWAALCALAWTAARLLPLGLAEVPLLLVAVGSAIVSVGFFLVHRSAPAGPAP